MEADREVPSVPITTLAGVSSLTDLLPEMPLPTPSPQTLSNKSLLFHPRVAEEAQNLLGVQDEVLVPQLINSLVQTSADHIDVKDNYGDSRFEQQESMPELLRAMLITNPLVFNGVQQASQDCNHIGSSSNPADKLIKPQEQIKELVEPSRTVQQSPSPALNPVNPQQPVNNQRPSVIFEQSPLPNQNVSNQPSQVADIPMDSQPSTTTELRQLRRPTRGSISQQNAENPQSVNPENVETKSRVTRAKSRTESKTEEPAEKSVEPKEEPVKEETKESDITNSTIEEPAPVREAFVKLDRLSEHDQQLMLESLSKFVESKPKLAKELGIDLPVKTEEEESEDDKSKKKDKKKAESDDEYAPDTFSALFGSRKRKMKDPVEKSKPTFEVSKPKLRRVEKKFVPVLEKLSQEELMETNTFQKFNKSIEHVLRSAEEVDVSEIVEDGMIQDEYLLSRIIMQELCTEAAKLKTLGAMESIPIDKLVRLLNILEINIRGGDNISPITDEDSESIRQYWQETTMERVMGAVDACLVCLYVMTSPNMPKRVYIEEVIDRVVLFIKYHLHNTIFPSYDSTYRLDNKKKDGRKKKSSSVSERGIQTLYTKISELVNLLAELLNIQVLTDTSVLHASSMGVSPFFAENVSEIQLACLKLVTTIFTRYENHRRLLLDDILASIARLPSTKRSLRTYRLNSEEHIQMLTALVLQLIQCVVALPDNLSHSSKDTKESKEQHSDKNSTDETGKKAVDTDILIYNKYEKALAIACTFLTVFLNKCGSKNEDIDYRPLFENFVNDLLATLNKPEWPATEMLLSILGRMLVSNFSNKSIDMALRVVSLDYLGVVAARLRRDKVVSHCKVSTIDQMIKDIKNEEKKAEDGKSSKKKKHADTESDDERTIFLQKVLLDFLSVKAQSDDCFKFARHFYISQWYKDVVDEKMNLASGNKGNKKNNVHKSRRREDSDDDLEEKPDNNQENAEKFKALEERKKFLVTKIKPFQESISSGNRVQIFQTYIDYSSAELITQYLASKRAFCQSFDVYLKQILIVVLKETSIAIRTKAMKCLTMIVEADPSVLGRHDMQMGVNRTFLDHSTSVREAAVDLVGKFVLSRPELIDKYYEMLSARILDTGVSVRKRVIKILKDICIECPDFPKIPEICVKMIRRVNDEEGIRKLVMEVFQNMWFTPTKDTSLLRKVMNITDVVASSKEIGLEWFEQLLLSLFKPKEDKEDSTKVQTEPPKALLVACRQIVDCLIENVLRLEETNDGSSSSQRLVACLTTLYLFAKIRPQLLVKHAITLQPYLGLKCQSHGDIDIITCVARILEMVVPLMDHPSESFLAQLEEDSIKLVLKQGKPVVSSCLACLGSIVNKVTRNFKLIRDIFKQYYKNLNEYKFLFEMDYDKYFYDNKCRPFIRRSLFIVGLLLRYFNFKDPEVIGDLQPDIVEHVYELMSYYLNLNDQDFQGHTLKAIGSICIRHYEFMLHSDLKIFYHNALVNSDTPLLIKADVLMNIENYLVEEENRMIQQNLEWAKRSKDENLKEMGDVSSGMASTIIQIYLKEILQSYLHIDLQVRKPALKVIQLIFQQGLVHPVQIVPYLICMSTDTEKMVSHTADKLLTEIETRYPGFTHTKASLGIRLSYQLQKILQGDTIVRGCKVKEKGDYPGAMNGFLYSLLRNVRQQRRALILNILKQFDEHARTTLAYMLYLADNLAYFPYMVQDEPLFIVHHIDIMISVSGTNLLQSFREGLIINEQQKLPIQSENGELITNSISALDEDDDDEDALVSRIPEDTSHLQLCITAAQGCLLLLMLKQHLKDIYGLSDSKIQQYSPTEPVKTYEKNISRRNNSLFNPKETLQKLKQGNLPVYLDDTGRRDLIRQYINFKQLMLQLDPDDPDDEENKGISNISNLSISTPSQQTPVLLPSDQVGLENYKDSSIPKVPKLVIQNRRLESDHKRVPRTPRVTDKAKKHRQKKRRRKLYSSDDDSENDYSDPDFLA